MGDIRINVRTLGTVMLIGFAGVWLINRGLAAAGMGNWQA